MGGEKGELGGEKSLNFTSIKHEQRERKNKKSPKKMHREEASRRKNRRAKIGKKILKDNCELKKGRQKEVEKVYERKQEHLKGLALLGERETSGKKR